MTLGYPTSDMVLGQKVKVTTYTFTKCKNRFYVYLTIGEAKIL